MLYILRQHKEQINVMYQKSITNYDSEIINFGNNTVPVLLVN